jgi:hypothetical protein
MYAQSEQTLNSLLVPLRRVFNPARATLRMRLYLHRNNLYDRVTCVIHFSCGKGVLCPRAFRHFRERI